jgi:hypothetical protein
MQPPRWARAAITSNGPLPTNLAPLALRIPCTKKVCYVSYKIVDEILGSRYRGFVLEQRISTTTNDSVGSLTIKLAA